MSADSLPPELYRAACASEPPHTASLLLPSVPPAAGHACRQPACRAVPGSSLLPLSPRTVHYFDSLCWHGPTQVMSADSLPAELYQAVCSFNADLLSASLGGRMLLVQRLAELVRVSPVGRGEARCGSAGCGTRARSCYPHTRPSCLTPTALALDDPLSAGQPPGGAAWQPAASSDRQPRPGGGPQRAGAARADGGWAHRRDAGRWRGGCRRLGTRCCLLLATRRRPRLPPTSPLTHPTALRRCSANAWCMPAASGSASRQQILPTWRTCCTGWASRRAPAAAATWRRSSRLTWCCWWRCWRCCPWRTQRGQVRWGRCGGGREGGREGGR